MANPYFKLFNAPGSKAFSSAGLIARLPVSMTGIGIITMLSQVRGSYWLAGAVAATFAFSMALLAPQIARAADRHGQSRVLPYATGISAIALLLLLLCTHYRAPDWTLFVFAALAGGMPAGAKFIAARHSCTRHFHSSPYWTRWPLSSAHRSPWGLAFHSSQRPALWWPRCFWWRALRHSPRKKAPSPRFTPTITSGSAPS